MPKRNQNRNKLQHSNLGITNSKSTAMSDEEFIARLSTLGSVIQTIGGVISTAASIIALQQFQEDILLEEEEDTGEGGQSGNNDRINQLERQMQYLINEIEELKGRKS